DGIFAPGLAAIYKELIKMPDVEVAVVAPADSQSGASHSITFSQPLVCNKVEIEGLFSGFSVHGSPADCVKLACMKLSDKPFDLLVAGINNGANAGININYSGTVGAAIEGAFMGIGSVAMSLAFEDEMDFESAAKHCIGILKKIMPVKKGDVINVNIPHLSKGKPKGVKVVPQAAEGFDENYIEKKNEQGQRVFQMVANQHNSYSEKSDMISLADGFITVTSLICDRTNHKKTQELKQIEW
ncbi:MAG: 5'/3'-nucleotidase SurE, partial [Planctomycetes bacterium]|nr:5'/3'-nucleotidase SurE [Planctomycetota bacterium]